jgi:hypothetical protein
LREIAAALTEHLGGDLTPPQQMLVQTTAVIWLRLSLMAPQMLAEGELIERNSHVFLAWANSLRRNLVELGISAQEAEQIPHLRDYIEQRKRRTA